MVSENNDIKRDLEEILKNVAKAKTITNYELTVNDCFSKGDGFLSEFFTGEIVNKDNGEKIHVGIKKAPNDTVVLNTGHEPPYKNEVYFYSKLFPNLDKFQKDKRVKHPFNHIPTYFVGNIEPRNMYIAMENLRMKGYVLHDRKECFNKEHIEFIFKVYGKFHALSFNFQKCYINDYKRLIDPIFDILKEMFTENSMVKNMENAYISALKAFDPVTKADVLVKLKKVKNVQETFLEVQAYKGNYKCITHGDCWSNNMLFKYKDSGELEDIKLIDLQLPRESTPIHDLSYFFYSAASKENIDQLDYFLNIYHESFSNFTRELGGNPEELFPLAVLKKEWKQYGLFGILLGCMVWSAKLLDKDKILEILNQKNVPADKYWDLFAEKVAEVYESEVYKERARNICLHAVEYGIL